MKKDVSLSTAAVVFLIALAIFMVWGALGGWSGMGPSMMGSVFDGMVLLGLVFIGFFAALVLWVWRNWRKKK